jgi:2-amino-4-hydroxy-6-hydroxymethyldihydropteridine diphosphokinase
MIMAQVYLGLGTNIGDRTENLNSAIKRIAFNIGLIVCQSAFYASKSWGFISENEFLNAVVLVESELLPFDLLVATQEIEKQLGRTEKTTQAYADRIIDIDILLYDAVVINEPKLKIPHPLMLGRDFVLIPLLEISPNIMHPEFLKPIKDFLQA